MKKLLNIETTTVNINIFNVACMATHSRTGILFYLLSLFREHNFWVVSAKSEFERWKNWRLGGGMRTKYIDLCADLVLLLCWWKDNDDRPVTTLRQGGICLKNFWKKLPEKFDKYYIYILYYKKVTISNILHLNLPKCTKSIPKFQKNQNWGWGTPGTSPATNPNPFVEKKQLFILPHNF